MVRDVLPTPLGDLARLVQMHLAVHDVPEQARVVLCADGHEIRPGLGIVISLEADGMAVVLLRIVCHASIMVRVPNWSLGDYRPNQSGLQQQQVR